MPVSRLHYRNSWGQFTQSKVEKEFGYINIRLIAVLFWQLVLVKVRKNKVYCQDIIVQRPETLQARKQHCRTPVLEIPRIEFGANFIQSKNKQLFILPRILLVLTGFIFHIHSYIDFYWTWLFSLNLVFVIKPRSPLEPRSLCSPMCQAIVQSITTNIYQLIYMYINV